MLKMPLNSFDKKPISSGAELYWLTMMHMHQGQGIFFSNSCELSEESASG
jgi:hypothetical protein